MSMIKTQETGDALPMRRMHVSIAGNIGVGKSTLVGILAEELRWQPYYE